MPIDRTVTIGFDHWLPHHQAAFEEILDEDYMPSGSPGIVPGVFEPYAEVKPATRHNYEQVIDRYLWWVKKHRPPHVYTFPLADLLRDEAMVVEFTRHCLERASGDTAVAYIERLKAVARRMMPGVTDQMYQRARELAAPFVKDEINKSPLNPAEIFAAGVEAMTFACKRADWAGSPILAKVKPNDRRRPYVTFRNGLMISVLALVPIRASDFVAMKTTDVALINGQYRVMVTWEKNNPGVKEPRFLPPEVTPWMSLYLNEVRKDLAGSSKPNESLWLSFLGTGLKYQGLYLAFTTTIEDFAAVELNPHRVRHAAATFARECGLSHEEGAAILGDRSTLTVQRYYDSSDFVFQPHNIEEFDDI